MTTEPANPALAELIQRREIWAHKPQLRLVYERWAHIMAPFIAPGPLLEIGSGSGLTKELFPNVLTSDIVRAPWLDLVADCTCLPVAANSVGTVIGFDVLHHAPDPHTFLDEAVRVLRPGGRILLMEPYITPPSNVAYRLLHHEDVCFHAYHRAHPDGQKTDPWEGNLAMANIVFDRQASEWPQRHPQLAVIRKQYASFFDFQFAAGFKPHAYAPMAIFQWLVRVDDLLATLMPWIGFRIFIVLEKRQ